MDAMRRAHLTLYTPVLLNLTPSVLALCTPDPPHAWLLGYLALPTL